MEYRWFTHLHLEELQNCSISSSLFEGIIPVTDWKLKSLRNIDGDQYNDGDNIHLSSEKIRRARLGLRVSMIWHPTLNIVNSVADLDVLKRRMIQLSIDHITFHNNTDDTLTMMSLQDNKIFVYGNESCLDISTCNRICVGVLLNSILFKGG